MRSPAARFLQIRARLDAAPDSALYAVQAYYLPGNQPATVKDITVKPAPAQGLGRRADRACTRSSGRPTTPTATSCAIGCTIHPEEHARRCARCCKESEILTRTNYDWSTDGVPDGYYRLRSKPRTSSTTRRTRCCATHTDSEPFLIDNHPPHVDGLKFANGRLSGVARDDQGPISKLEYAIDGQDWKPFLPEGRPVRHARGSVRLELKDVASGPHVIAVRTKDARNNVGSAEVWTGK